MRRETYAQQAYAELREWVLTGRLPAGRKLIVRELAEQLDISPTPIKQALAMLTREGLLVSEPHRGVTVPVSDVSQVRDAFEVLTVLDGLAVHTLAERDDRAGILAELAEIIRTERAQPPADASNPHPGFQFEFHRPIWAGCGNARLAEYTESLTGMLLVASEGQLDAGERNPQILAEHEEMLQLLTDGKAAAARRLAERHMRRTAETTIARVSAALTKGAR